MAVLSDEHDPYTMTLLDVWVVLFHARCQLMEDIETIRPREAFDILWEAQDAVIEGRDPNWSQVNAKSLEQAIPKYTNECSVRW